MDKLRTRLRAAVDADFQGSTPKASKAAGLNPNAIDEIFQNPKREPKVSTLNALAELFGWTLCEAAYWTLDREPPVSADYDPVREMRRAWRVLKLDPADERVIMRYVELAVAQGQVSRTAPLS